MKNCAKAWAQFGVHCWKQLQEAMLNVSGALEIEMVVDGVSCAMMQAGGVVGQVWDL